MADSSRARASRAKQALADLDAVQSALAHASRRQILLVLHYRGGEMNAGEIANRFQCSWPTTTRHLGILLDAGLVHVKNKGRSRIYQLNRKHLLKIAAGWLANFELD